MFQPEVEELLASRAKDFATVFCGPNNCGKTLLLKQIFSLSGEDGYLVSCNRFSQVDIINTRQQEAAQYRNYYNNFVQNWHTSRQNTEDSEFKLEQAITGLSNPQREHLFAICKNILGNSLSLKKTQPDNDFSPFYVDMDGQNLRYGSTGTRLLLTLIGILLNEKFRTLLIDEPEIGLSPNSQSAVAALIFDPESRKRYWPHLQQIYIATHSHLFLDRRVISNNYIVRKTADTIRVNPVRSMSDFHELQFKLLGNEFESVFLPSAIVIVEGESDVTFLARLAGLHIPNKKIAVVRAGGDGEVLDKLNVLRETFGDISASPYRDRLFVVLDQRHSLRVSRIKGLGVPAANITVWSKNGIEHQYPTQLVSEAFRCSPEDLTRINLEVDPIEFNDIRKTKKELAQIVGEGLAISHALGTEMDDLLRRLRAACG
jgi:predicted ATPase